MPPTNPRVTPVQAKASEASGGASSQVTASTLTSGAQPAFVMKQVRALIKDDYAAAQKLAAAAAARFPRHDEIQHANTVLNSPTGPVGTTPPEPSTDKEFEWLRDAPESVRGKWVALSGEELVASADKLSDLAEVLRSRHPGRRTLVHRVE